MYLLSAHPTPPTLGIVPIPAEHILLPYMCQSRHLFNNPMRLAVFLVSSHIRGNRGTKRLSKWREVTQPLRTGPLMAQSLFTPVQGVVSQHVQATERKPVWLGQVCQSRSRNQARGCSEGPISNLDFILITLGSTWKF